MPLWSIEPRPLALPLSIPEMVPPGTAAETPPPVPEVVAVAVLPPVFATEVPPVVTAADWSVWVPVPSTWVWAGSGALSEPGSGGSDGLIDVAGVSTSPVGSAGGGATTGAAVGAGGEVGAGAAVAGGVGVPASVGGVPLPVPGSGAGTACADPSSACATC